jgi:hypothetical protein
MAGKTADSDTFERAASDDSSLPYVLSLAFPPGRILEKIQIAKWIPVRSGLENVFPKEGFQKAQSN